MPQIRSLCEIFFDRGTLVFKIFRKEDYIKLKKHTACVWDQTSSVFRAQPHTYLKTKTLLQTHFKLKDHIKKTELPPCSWRPTELRKYQEEALVAWESHQRRGTVCLPTGAGKTRVAVAAIKQSNAATLCLVPTRVLLHQWIETISQFYQGPIGQIGDGKRVIKPITVATFESAYRSMPQIGSMFNLLIVDEVHHFGNGMRDEALIMSIAPYRLGLTATPPTDPNAIVKLNDLVGTKVYQKNIADLRGKHLSDFRYTPIHVKLNFTELSQYNQNYQNFSSYYKAFKKTSGRQNWLHFVEFASRSREGRLALSAHHRARRIVSMSEAKIKTAGLLIMKFPTRKTIFFTSNTETAIKLSCQYLIPAVTAEIGKKERESIRNSFRSGDIHHIVSCRVLNEGVDVPDAEIAVIVGGSSNTREQVQRIGRVLRKSEGKVADIVEMITLGTFEQRHAFERGRGLASY